MLTVELMIISFIIIFSLGLVVIHFSNTLSQKLMIIVLTLYLACNVAYGYSSKNYN